MVDFKDIELKDKAWIDPLLKMSDFKGSEYVFSNNYNWKDIYHIQVAQVDGYYCVRSGIEERSYLYPSGSGDIAPVIEALIQDAKERECPFQMHGIVKENVALLETLFPGRFAFEEYRDGFDYIYNTVDLATLSGKKYHGKRNHITKFKQNHPDWVYEPITAENIEECRAMNKIWCEKQGNCNDPSLKQELCAVKKALDHFFDEGLKGGLIRTKEEGIVAYSIGAPLSSDTFIVHIEKAFAEVQGAYPIINQEFVRHNCMDYKYVNREDDVGDEGLRKAKLSYKPAILLEKYTATLK